MTNPPNYDIIHIELNKKVKNPMTRKDFQLIANVLSSHNTSPANRMVVKELAVSFASELAKTNPRFNKQRFVEACNVKS